MNNTIATPEIIPGLKRQLKDKNKIHSLALDHLEESKQLDVDDKLPKVVIKKKYKVDRYIKPKKRDITINKKPHVKYVA